MTVRAGRAGSRAGAGAGGTAPTVLDPARIRNVVLVGPSGAGKTTLVEALLAHTGTIPRAGTIVDGGTVCDHDPAAVRQQRSVALAVAPLMHAAPGGPDTKINLIDTPGYGDFVGELRAGLRAADAALFVVPASAGREGAIDPATVTQWEECAAVGMPRAVVVSRCDHPRADVEATVAACQDAFGAGVAPLYLPTAGRRRPVSGLYGLISQTPEGAAPPDADDARATLLEGIIEQSEDETLMERYLGGEEIEHRHAGRRPGDRRRPRLLPPGRPRLRDGRHRAGRPAGAARRRVPVTAGAPAAPRLRGRRLRAAPADRGPGRAARGRGRPHLRGRLRGPGVAGAGVLRDAAARDIGARQRARPAACHGATGPPTTAATTSTSGSRTSTSRWAQLREVEACVAGDIAALTKLGSAETGDTVSAAADPLLLSCWNLPDPLLPVAVVARSRADEDALGRRWPGSSPRTRRCAWSATPRRTRRCCGAWARRTRTSCCRGCGPAAPRSTPSRSRCRCAPRSATRRG